jgi:hypothetical protein
VEDLGLPLIFPAGACTRPTSVDDAPDAPKPGPAPPPLTAGACASLQLLLSQTHHGPLSREAYVKAFDGAAPALREAVCACPPRADRAWLVVTTTPDHGDLAARIYAPEAPVDAPVDACLAQHLRDAALPRWHLGTDCIGCGARRYGVLPGSPPADSAPVDGIATISFLVGVAR